MLSRSELLLGENEVEGPGPGPRFLHGKTTGPPAGAKHPQAQPDYTGARFNLARVLAKSGQLAEAIGDYRKVVEALANDPLPRVRLAGELLRDGEPNEAMAQFRRVPEMDPINAEAKRPLAGAAHRACP